MLLKLKLKKESRFSYGCLSCVVPPKRLIKSHDDYRSEGTELEPRLRLGIPLDLADTGISTTGLVPILSS